MNASSPDTMTLCLNHYVCMQSMDFIRFRCYAISLKWGYQWCQLHERTSLHLKGDIDIA